MPTRTTPRQMPKDTGYVESAREALEKAFAPKPKPPKRKPKPPEVVPVLPMITTDRIDYLHGVTWCHGHADTCTEHLLVSCRCCDNERTTGKRCSVIPQANGPSKRAPGWCQRCTTRANLVAKLRWLNWWIPQDNILRMAWKSINLQRIMRPQ